MKSPLPFLFILNFPKARISLLGRPALSYQRSRNNLQFLRSSIAFSLLTPGFLLVPLFRSSVRIPPHLSLTGDLSSAVLPHFLSTRAWGSGSPFIFFSRFQSRRGTAFSRQRVSRFHSETRHSPLHFKRRAAQSSQVSIAFLPRDRESLPENFPLSQVLISFIAFPIPAPGSIILSPLPPPFLSID